MSWLEDFKYRVRTPKQMQRLDDNTYYGGNLGGVTITKKRKKPYWVSPRGAGNMTVMPGDPEMVFFAPIAAGAGIAASPVLLSAGSAAMNGVNAAGDALAATAAGQRLTSGLNFAANAIGRNKMWPWIDAGLTSVFGAHGIDKVASGDIHNVGDVIETGLDLLPLSQLARPVANTAGRIGNTVRETVNSAVDKFPWTYRIPENPNMAYRRMGPLERDWLMEGNELSTRDTNILTEAESKAARTDPKYNITTKNGLRFNFFKAGAEHGGRKQFAKGQPWRGTTVTHGEEQVLAIPGKDLPWVSGRHYEGPQGTGFRVGDVPFEEAPFGSHIDLLTEEGYTGVNPSLLNGSVIYSPFKILGRNFGYRKLYPMNTSTPRGLLSNEPLIARGGYEVAKYPGYQLKGLMGGSPLERQLSKNGTININQLNAYFNKASQLEREVANKVLTEKFAGQKTIDYNQFKKAIQDELIGSYNRVPQTEWADYGVNALGYHPKQRLEMRTDPRLERFTDEFGEGFRFREDGRLLGSIDSDEPWWFENYPKLNTFTFESPRIPYGNTKHYGGNPIGHSRTYTLPKDPHTLYVMESQSDWAQQGLRKKTSIDAQAAYERASQSAVKHQQEIEQMKANLEKGLAPDGHKIQYEWEQRDIEEIIKQTEKQLASNNARAARFDAILHPEKYVQENYLKQNYLQRQLQENLRYAAENGQTRMRYPTPETAAEIEGYQKNVLARTPEEEAEMQNLFKEEMTLRSENPNSPRLKEISDRMNEIGNGTKRIYPLEHQTILKKYADFPKLFQKLYKGRSVRTVTDTKGNTWYEVDVPENYLNMEWQFKKGGQLIPRNVITRFKK